MIKANELRLNNWVNITGTPIKLAGEKFLYILAEDGLITRCEGIPITPEILESAGFYRNEYQCFSSLENGNIGSIYIHDTLSPLNLIIFEGGEIRASDGTFIVSQNIKYLHQLQNLYFALTNKELSINLTASIHESR